MPWELKILKLLFVCSTEFQLFNVLNMKMHLFPNDSADIIIQFLKEDTVEFYNRVRETGIFENVCYRLPDVFGLHEYARCVRKGDYSHSFVGAANNSMKEFFTNLSSRTSHEFIDNVKDCVYNVESLDFSSYQEIFAGGANDIVTNILKHVHAKYPDCKINLYEEGLASYFGNKLGNDCGDIKKNKVYLYEPEMALYEGETFAHIPKVSRDDKDFLRAANFVFNFKPQIKTINHKIVFFDDPSNPMPAYLERSKLLANTVFRVPYKKHLPEHRLYLRQLEAYKILTENSGDWEIWVKLHPRTERESAKRDYGGESSKIMGDISVPWELFCCNCDIRNNVFVTDISSAIYANAFTVKGEDTNAFIILAEYMGDWNLGKAKQFYEKFRRKKSDIYFPATEEEYIKVLRDVLQSWVC